MGPEAALFYKEMHHHEKQVAPEAPKPLVQKKLNFASRTIDEEVTPYEKAHPQDLKKTKTLT